MVLKVVANASGTSFTLARSTTAQPPSYRFATCASALSTRVFAICGADVEADLVSLLYNYFIVCIHKYCYCSLFIIVSFATTST